MIKDDELMHYGILRKSGRFPYGSGKNPHQRSISFLDSIDELKKQGLTEAEIWKGLGLNSSTDYRALKSLANDIVKAERISTVEKLKAKGYSNVAIGQKLGINESVVRSYLAPGIKEKRDISFTIANQIKEKVSSDSYLDIGEGTSLYAGVSKVKLATAVTLLKNEGYQIKYLTVNQLGTKNFTSVKFLVPPGLTNKEIYSDPNLKDKIKAWDVRTDDGGRSFYGLRTPTNFSSKRLMINYAEDGGNLKDGVIELRPGVDDLSMGNARYSQVRIAVDGTHYIKGMAVYANDLPDGVDIRFNTNKTRSEAPTKLDALKKMKDDPDNPFGAAIKPGGQKGVLNILNEEGDWDLWSKSLSSQMLSKQSPSLIKKQLGLTYDSKKEQFDEIVKLTNPTIKKKLLETFADDVDASSVNLNAMGLPGTKSHVILPVNSIKETEVYAPQYRDGDRVVLVRHPHGGIFEIPELTVNNRNIKAKSIMGRAPDAIGINPKVAEQLSGADFDGDTVLVIPNRNKTVKTSPALESLKNFDPRSTYRQYEGMKVMADTQIQMGKVSNLITDMTIKGASTDEIVRAVRHSMVVIDAEKHKLNWKQSEKDHGISELKEKYQGGKAGGASTIISRAKKDVRVLERKGRSAAEGGPIDKETGEKVFVNTGKSYVNKDGITVFNKTTTTKMAETKDAFTLSSGTPREALYADHANKLKALANSARKEAVNTDNLVYSPSAKATYDTEVKSLNAKLNIAMKNAPLERQAQLLANSIVKAKVLATPTMDKETRKKIEGQALKEARERNGAKKQRVTITPKEWEAIQAGAISNSKLSAILNNADLDEVKKLATPRAATVMTPTKVAKAQSMLSAGYTQAEVAEALGVPTSTLSTSIGR
jgi:DNA-binding CsgD family transcriptional regulator